jgi:hypothetical protein
MTCVAADVQHVPEFCPRRGGGDVRGVTGAVVEDAAGLEARSTEVYELVGVQEQENHTMDRQGSLCAGQYNDSNWYDIHMDEKNPHISIPIH